MRIFSYLEDGRQKLGLVHVSDSDKFIDLNECDPALPTGMAQLLRLPGGIDRVRDLSRLPPSSALKPAGGIRYLPVVVQPGKVVCMGLNYADHAKEGGNARPDYPSFFLRAGTSLVAHDEPIIRPKASTKLDYEAELAVIIGRKARHLTKANALDCIAGYSCFNDASLRDYQRKSAQWTIGKNFDLTGAFGPWLVTPDELPVAGKGLRIQSRLNGQVMQDANTRDLLWGVAESLTIITECMTLEPGDVVITGTPAGVGYARTPPVWMEPGDVCEIEVEGIGVLRNDIADERCEAE